MFLNILITLFLLGLRLAEQKEPVAPKSFLRPNIPLPYKYNPLYDYSLEKSGKYTDQLTDYFRPRNNILKTIQYAPVNPEEIAFPGPQRLIPMNKVHLEPKLIEQSKNTSQGSQENFIQYIEGHNIVIPLSRHKDNGYRHGTSSKKSKEINEIDDDDLVSKHKQENPEPQKDEVSLKAVTTPSAYIDFNNKQNLPKNNNPSKSFLSAIEIPKIEPVFNPYVKVPRLHLNIARSYNFARLPLKASLMGYQMNKSKHPFVQNFDFLLNEKTFMYPVNSNHFKVKSL